MVTSEEISDDMLKHLARSVTLWEFLMLKINRGRSGSDRRVRIADILTEFSELHKKVKLVSRQTLTPLNELSGAVDDEHFNKRANKTLMLESKELAQCIGLPTGRYEINPAPELIESSLIDCRPLIPPLRRRAKPIHRDMAAASAASTAPATVIDYVTPSFEMADGSELRQYIIEPSSDADAQSVLQGHVDGSGQQLVLVAADSGELLLQCDLKDYQNMVQNGTASVGTSFASLDDIRSLVGLQAVEMPVVTAAVSAGVTVEGDYSG
jgi:hypothetical protein